MMHEWAQTWGIPEAALLDLEARLIAATIPERINDRSPEELVSKAVRLEAPRKECILWRNNVGMAVDARGNHFRYGLANDSPQMNKRVKSSDLIGIRKVLITPDMIGRIIGQFIARETKKGSWTYSGTEHEKAQANYLALVESMGGDAKFATAEGTL